MNIDKTITDISLYHNEWILYVRKNGFNSQQILRAEDVVQNMYCKILESTSFDCDKFYNNQNQINKNYVFKVLRSLLVDEYRKKKLPTTRIDYELDSLFKKANDIKTNHAKQEKILSELKKALKEIPEGELMTLYMYEIPSIRKLSKELGRGTRTIRLKLKNAKEILKQKLYDYKNN